MKLVIEKDHDGAIFVYKEDEKHHKKVEPSRASRMKRLAVDQLANECGLAHYPNGVYFVINIKDK
jgi:hypothetical protein